jgi:hypothetical protein
MFLVSQVLEKVTETQMLFISHIRRERGDASKASEQNYGTKESEGVCSTKKSPWVKEVMSVSLASRAVEIRL